MTGLHIFKGHFKLAYHWSKEKGRQSIKVRHFQVKSDDPPEPHGKQSNCMTTM